MIVVAIIGILAAIAVPNFIRARSSSQVKACIYNLQKLNGAKAQWALENKKGNDDIPMTADIVVYLRANQLPPCPANGTYRLRRVSRIPACSLYVNGHTLNNLNMDDDPNVD